MSVFPVALERLDSSELMIRWSDDHRQVISLRTLREHCPCASCRHEKQQSRTSQDGLPILTHAETLPLEIVHMSPVGNYAYNIHFSDGHNTGIYTFDLLRSMGT